MTSLLIGVQKVQVLWKLKCKIFKFYAKCYNVEVVMKLYNAMP